ncbi:hypothetical protein EDB19DRAFT_1911400 [Suillus lakei]|nr:hypothetical protein EDB19DRAFT_1911400 [Suillus lakei]
MSSAHKQNATCGGLQPKAVFNIESYVKFLKLAFPGILMVGAECDPAAERLGELPLAAQCVIMTTDQIISTLPFWFGSSPQIVSET